LIGAAVLVVLLIGTGAWLMMSVDDGESADGGLTHLATDEDGASTLFPGAATPGQPMTTSVSHQVTLAPDSLATSDDKPTGSIDPSPVSGLRIGAQSWQRGGLGSKALVTFTLRNGNRYAVKDVEIACAFSRRDGSHLTDRKRVLPGSVNMKSRKTFAGVHVGFVNVNASKAKCTLVAANKI
jgi:type IV pilus biogenesis protein CpaD/CtpE